MWEGQRVRGGVVGLGQAGEEQRWRGQKRCGGVALRVQDWEAQVVPSSAEGVNLGFREVDLVLKEERGRKKEGGDSRYSHRSRMRSPATALYLSHPTKTQS